LFEPPQFALVLPNARTRNGVGQTVKDLSEDPYAGADVTLTLTAKDEAGNEGKSEPFNMRLPERLFTKPLARALIEQRRILALDANQNAQVFTALDALMIAPELFTPEAGHYLGLFSVSRQLEAARTDVALREVVASLWALAVTIEDGNISDVDKALRAAQEALKQALERGATDEEIKKLTDNLRAALDNFLRQLAEQFRNNPQQLARPLDPNTKMLSQQDLKSMLDRLERMSRFRRQGSRQAAIGTAAADAGKPADGAARPGRRRHGAGAERARRHDPQAAAIARQDLQAGPGFQARPLARQTGRPEHGRPAAGPAGPARPAQEIAGRTRQARHGAGPARSAGPARPARRTGAGPAGSRAATRATARTGSIRPIRRWATPPAGSARAMPTARWTHKAARWKRCARAPRAWPKPCSRATATSRATAPALPEAASRARPNSTDPLGRPMRNNEFTDDYTGEDPRRDRRAAGAPDSRRAAPPSRRSSRPQIELDYIERLLKDY
jgi:hypothetical protein